MKEKKHTYQSDILGLLLPTTRKISGEIPNPDPNEKNHPWHMHSDNKTNDEAKNTIAKLIGHLKNGEK